MHRYRRLLFVFLAAAALCAMVWQSARMQSPLRRITNTTEEGISTNPSISGDGRIVGFESTEDIAHAGGAEGFRAIRANVAVDPATFLQMGAARSPAPAISQDGSRIAFAAKDNPLGTNNDANSEIFLYDGARLIQVTNTSPGGISNRAVNGNFSPSISDDGRFIAFSSNRDLANQNADANLEVFIYDSIALSFTQLTNSSGIVGASDVKLSGNAASVAYIRDNGASPGTTRSLLLQNRVGPPSIRTLATNAPLLAMTYGRAISDDGARVVWSAQTATNTTQVFLFDGRNDNTTRQITTLGSRVTDVPLHPSISGDGSKISFATRRTVLGSGTNSDGSVELYTFDLPSGTLARVTNTSAGGATADVVSSMNDDGSVIAFNFPRLLSGPVSQDVFENDSEIYLSGTPPRPTSGTLTVLNRASFGHEPSTTKAVAPDSIAVALGGALAFTTRQAERQADGTFPTTVAGTTVTVNGLPAQIFFVSPNEVHFHVPVATSLGTVEVVVTNSDGFQSRGNVTTLRAAPGVFTRTGDGLGDGTILNADTMQPGPFDPTDGNLRLIVFATGVRNGTLVSVTAGGRALTLESIVQTANMPGMDEIHVLVPADLRGVGRVDLIVRADGRDSNPAGVEFSGDARRDVLINEFLADPPDGAAGDANRDGVRDSADDEFVELVNSTTHDIDLSGYRIFTRGTGSDTLRHVFAAGTILRPCSAIVVFGDATAAFNPNDPAFGGALVVKSTTHSLSLVNSGGVISLQDQTGAIVNLIAYGGSSAINADNNQSVTRSPDITGNFAQHLTASGGVRAFSPGTQINGAAFSSCTPAVARVEVSPASATTEVAAQQQFTARAFDAANNEIPGVIFSWQSSNTAVATIDQNGLASGQSPGQTEIRATGRGVVSPPAMLTVNPATPVLTSVTLTPVSATIAVNEQQQFTAQAKDQTGQDIGGVTITFASNNENVARVFSTSPTSSTGSATAIVFGLSSGSAEIRASATNGTITITSSPATLTVEAGRGQLKVSEFRTRGPSGAADEFVEIYNPTFDPLIIGGLKIRASNGSGTISDRVTITAGTTLGPGCHYLLANSSSGGYSGSVIPNQTYGTGITDDGGIAITGSDGIRIIDAVGMSSGSAFKEGTPLTPLTGTSDQSYERKPGGTLGNGFDTDNNANDFVLTAPSNPQNSSSGCLDTTTADLSITKTDSPDPVTIGSNVTYTITITNHGVRAAQVMQVVDNLPGSVTFVSCSSTGGGVCGGSGNNRTVTFSGFFAPGASAVVTLVATANGPVGTTITNTASVGSVIPEANFADNTATATTTVQAPQPLLSINDVAANEGNSGTSSFTFTVSLAAPAPAPVTFDIATQDNTATSASGDYVARSLTSQSIATGQQTYTFDVTVNGDTLVEPNETFFVNVTNISGADATDSQGLGTIQNDDTANLVISQVYGGGGNAGAQYANDFVEIFNRGATSINFAATPYSVQYAGATASFGSSKVDLTSGTMAPGQYFLVQLSSGGANGSPLPAPDATGTVAMAATAGKVALVAGTTALSGSGCPLSASVADFVGYGTTADCFEGTGRAPAPSNTSADFRKAGGCTDTNQNVADFFVAAPFPRNTAAAINNCVAGAPPNLTINDITVAEGNSGTTAATFTVSLSAPAPSTDISFDIATADGTAQDDNPATEDNDYVARSLTNQIIPAGQQTYTFTVNLNGDTNVEPNETFFANVSNVTGAALTDGQGMGTIQNDDLPALSVNDVAQNETNAGTTTFTFTVSLSAPAPAGGVTFDIATGDNTATVADNDYVTRALLAQTIPAGSQTYTFDVTVNGDVVIEPNETFFVNVTSVTGATVADGQGQGTILNDDSPVLSVSDVSANETNSGTTTFTFTVTSTLPAPAGGITFDIATADGTAQDDTPPTEDNDYVARSLTTQAITAGNTTYTFDVTVNGDTFVEPNETFFVNISNVSGAAISDGQGQGTIQNDDAAVLVISQVYAGGGNAGAQYTNDFVEIFNRGANTINFAVTPYSIQYAGATALFGSSKVDLTSGTMAPGQYFLIQLSSGGASGSPLPTPDVSGSIAMAATAGKVALVAGTTALSGSGCPLAGTVADFVGYGTTADCFEGSGRAPAPSNTTADLRKAGGCTDTNDNVADFLVTAPFPRNTSSPFNGCVAGAPPNLTINDVTIAEGNAGTSTATFTVSLSAPAPSTDITFDIATQDNTATTANSDYVPRTLTNQIIPAGQQTFTFTVTVNGDAVIEPDETFFVNVTNASGATITDGQGVGTIQNDDLPSLTINDVSQNETNAGTTTFTFTVSLSAPAPAGGATFNIATQDDTATVANNDYVARSLNAQTIPAGNTTYTFDVTVNGDLTIEPNETFFVNVTSVTGAVVVDSQGLGTILNDDSPALSVSDVSQNETNSGTTIFTFTVTSSLPAPAGGITFDIATADGTAQDDTPPSEDNDYVARSLTAQTISAGNTTYTFDVTVNGDTLVEPNETFFVNLTNVSNAAVNDGTGQATIQNDDTASLVVSQVYGGGGNAGAQFTNDFVELFNRGTTTINFAATPYSVQYAGATASFGSSKVDLTSGTMAPGQYFLIQLSSGGVNGVALPSPDATGSINMAAGAGKVALVSGTTALGGSGCPLPGSVADFVGYGTTADCFEGAGRAPAPGNTTADLRKAGGCTDTNDNAADFLAQAPNPRNSASPLNDCNAPPNLTIDNVTIAEGNGGPTLATFTVTLSSPAPLAGVTFDIGTQDNTATTGDSDYVTHSLNAQTISSGNTSYTFDVTINGDMTVEPDETFFVNVSNVTGAIVVDGQGLGTIQNDDSAPLPNLSINDVTQSETNAGTTTFTFTVTSSAPAPAGGITFNIATADGSAQDDTPPSEDNDYVARSLLAQTIAAGNTTYTFDVTVNGDTLVELDETFTVNLSSVTGANLTDGVGQGTIQNDDTANLVISQVYGGGGNASATYTNDFIEIFNRGTTTVDFSVTPYSVQYAAATSNFTSNKTDITSGILLPGHYFLIQEASGGANGVALPTPDVSTGTINMSATAGKVALVSGTVSLTGSGCPFGATIVDFLGYGATANCSETAPIAVSGTNSNARSVIRTASCTDTNNNSADFSNPVTAPVARNTATAPTVCP